MHISIYLFIYYMSQKDTNQVLQKKSSISIAETRQDKLNSIQALYRAQIKQIYSASKDPPAKPQYQIRKSLLETPKTNDQKLNSNSNIYKSQIDRGLNHAKSTNNIMNIQGSSTSRTYNFQEADDKIRASVFLKGESTRTIQILQKQNESKELKIRQLTSKCQNLIDKLKNYLGPEELQIQMRHIKETSDNKTQRLQKLFKIKNQQIFFKIKLQIIGLLQEFGIKKQQLNDINQVSNEANLFSFMARKLKNRLKDFKSKEQESHFEIQKDKVLNQKHEERIHFLIQTNELLKLSENKVKSKVEDLKTQLREYIQKLKIKEQQKESIENEVFKLTRQNEELNIVNQKLNNALKGVNGDKVDERRIWQAKQKELKTLLGNYNLQKKRMQGQLQQKQGQMQEVLIKQSFLQQENQRLNRELVRWKERYEWTEHDKQNKLREVQEEKANLISSFENYKNQNNQGIILGHRAEIDQAFRKIYEYQKLYEEALNQLDEEKRLFQRFDEKSQEKLLSMEREWLNRVKNIEKQKEQELYDAQIDNENRLTQMREIYEQKEQHLAEQMQARMKTILAERDKKTTQQFIRLQNDNDNLRRQIQNLQKLLDVKESLLNIIQNKNASLLPQK